ESPLYQITPGLEDMPQNGDCSHHVIFPMENAPYGNWGNTLSHNFTPYLRCGTVPDRQLLETHLEEYVQKHCLPVAKEYMNVSSMEEFRTQGNVFYYDVTPITDIHLYSNLAGELQANGSMQYVYIFGGISLFILLIACVN